MPYWNRDLCDPARTDAEPFHVWHDGCFPVPLTPWWQKAHEHEAPDARPASLEEHVDRVFGGASHRAELEAAGGYYAADIVRCRENAAHRMTPTGYAWAPWRGGAPCAACGVDC
jgi:hypothetical protein